MTDEKDTRNEAQYREICPSEGDLEDVTVDYDKKYDEMSDEELIIAHYGSWSAINVTDVFGVSDLKMEMATASRLAERGWSIGGDPLKYTKWEYPEEEEI